MSLLVGGVRARGALNRQVPVGAALRQATVRGIALYFVHHEGSALTAVVDVPGPNPSTVPPLVSALALLTVTALAWTGSRLAVGVGAVAAIATSIWWSYSSSAWIASLGSGTHAPGCGELLRNAILLMAMLAILVG